MDFLILNYYKPLTPRHGLNGPSARRLKKTTT